MATSILSTSAERVEKDRVKMRVEVPESELTPAVNAVYKRWANQIKMPGFRKGKVPRQLIDQRVGPDLIREEALRDALPDLYRRALEAEELEPIAPPDIEVVEFESGAPLVFEATIDLRPGITLPDLGSLQIDAPSAEVSDEDVNEQIDRLRERFAELETVGREARRGDHVLIDLKGYHHDQPVEGASAPDFLYEVGSRSGPPRLDEELEGARPGAILKFNAEVPQASGDAADQEISFTVLVKEVKAKKLPRADDEFAKTVGEFDSLSELKDDIRSRLAEMKRELVEEQIRGLALEALVNASDLEPPEKLVGGEFEHRMEHFNRDLQQAGVTMEQYAESAQSTELEIRSRMRTQAEASVKAELLLEEIARREDIEVTNEDLSREVTIAAIRAEREPQEVAKELADSGRLGAVAADIMRRKALDHVVATANVTGRPMPEDPEDKDADGD